MTVGEMAERVAMAAPLAARPDAGAGTADLGLCAPIGHRAGPDAPVAKRARPWAWRITTVSPSATTATPLRRAGPAAGCRTAPGRGAEISTRVLAAVKEPSPNAALVVEDARDLGCKLIGTVVVPPLPAREVNAAPSNAKSPPWRARTAIVLQ